MLHQENFVEECDKIIALFKYKNEMYHDSFFTANSTDLQDALVNLKRKMVRIDLIIRNLNYEKNLVLNFQKDSIYENLQDLAVYALMTLISIKENEQKQ